MTDKTGLQYKIDILMKEIELIDNSITRIDEIINKTKNWAVGFWGGSFALILQNKSAFSLVILTAMVPVLFWAIDHRWRQALLRCSFRQKKISDFINSPVFMKSIEKGEIKNFILLDPTGSQYVNNDELINILKFRNIIRYKDSSLFYLGMIGISIIVWFLLASGYISI